MPRKPRIHLPGGFYHIILRGNARQDIYFDSADRIAWQALLEKGLDRYEHRVHAYCWMTNHVHMALQAGAEPLARFMTYLASNYARRINCRKRRSGHLFERRYRAILVQDIHGGVMTVTHESDMMLRWREVLPRLLDAVDAVEP